MRDYAVLYDSHAKAWHVIGKKWYEQVWYIEERNMSSMESAQACVNGLEFDNA